MPITTICDLRGSFGVARDQGSRPTCVAFAVSDAHAAVRGPYVALSVDHLYWHALQRIGGPPNDGVPLETTLESLQDDGQCAESGWPYVDPLPADLSTWRPPATATPTYRRGSKTIGTGTSTIVDQLEKSRAVVVTLLLGERFFQPANGIIVPGPGDADAGYHGVVAVGHGEDGSERYILVRNSWGRLWGLEGHAWVHVDYLETRLHALALISNREVA